jgi:fatty-acyl-CoA synthase
MALAESMGPTEVPLIEETIGEVFSKTAARLPDHEALVVRHQGRRYTYGELEAAVDRLARGLMALGIEKGDRVGMWSPNNAEWVLVQFATAKVGAILVNINPAYRASEVEYALRQSGCRMLISAPRFKTSDYPAMIEEVRANLPDLEREVYLGTPEWERLAAGEGAITDADLIARGASLSTADAINIQYTSGTTGFPKGATLTHRNILNNSYFMGIRLGYTHEDRICVPVPFYHCFGMVAGNLCAAVHGATVVVPDEAFEATAVLETVEVERCTSLYGVPTMFIAELEHPEFDRFDLSSLRTGGMGGSPCPIEVMKQCIARMNMREVAVLYGMTELSPVITQTDPNDPLEFRTGTVGRALDHVEVKIVSPETGETVARGVEGECCARGYGVMQGYWNDPERTAEAIDADGFMHTGDVAVMDADGYVNIRGRTKDMIIRGGENISPREIEEYLYTHPDVSDVQVVGVPDRKFGEEVMAWVQLREGAQVDEQALRDFCRGAISHYKVPRYIRFTKEFPLTVTGKIQKFRLRDMAVEELELEGQGETA